MSSEIQIKTKAELDRCQKELKQMSAVLRIPSLTNEFQRMARQQEAEQKKALGVMMDEQVKDEHTRTEFLKKMLVIVDRVKNQRVDEQDMKL